MGRKNVELLLTDNVENLGIVGDVVKVKPGYARNFLLPHGLAERPSQKRLAELQERRRQVQAEIAAQRKSREALHGRMEAIEIAMIRSCNDQGMLYGSVSQRDISDALRDAGYDVDVRSVRLGQPIKRVGSYPVPIQLDRDLRTEITLRIDPDHAIGEEREEMEFDNEGRLIRRKKQRKEPAAAASGAEGEQAGPSGDAESAADRSVDDKPRASKARSKKEPRSERRESDEDSEPRKQAGERKERKTAKKE